MYPNVNHLLEDEFDLELQSPLPSLSGLYPASQEPWAFSNQNTTPTSATFPRRPSAGFDMNLAWSSNSSYRADSLDAEYPLYPRRYSESSVRNDSGSEWSDSVDPSHWSPMAEPRYWDAALPLSDIVEESKPDISKLLGSPSPSTTSASDSSPPPRLPPSKRSSSNPSGDTAAAAAAKKSCSHCHATSTPLWRRDPTSLKPLCNACGLYLQQRNKLRPQELIDADLDNEEDESEKPEGGPECTHCHTRNTSVWRRSKTGAQLCNACGVYARLRGRDRPLSLKRNKIKPRSKHAKC